MRALMLRSEPSSYERSRHLAGLMFNAVALFIHTQPRTSSSPKNTSPRNVATRSSSTARRSSSITRSTSTAGRVGGVCLPWKDSRQEGRRYLWRRSFARICYFVILILTIFCIFFRDIRTPMSPLLVGSARYLSASQRLVR
jgi:hypothetical protein